MDDNGPTFSGNLRMLFSIPSVTSQDRIAQFLGHLSTSFQCFGVFSLVFWEIRLIVDHHGLW